MYERLTHQRFGVLGNPEVRLVDDDSLALPVEDKNAVAHFIRAAEVCRSSSVVPFCMLKPEAGCQACVYNERVEACIVEFALIDTDSFGYTRMTGR